MDEGVRGRALGCLLGQACGDALGTTVEFMAPERIAERFPGGIAQIVGGGPFGVLPGQITDDTELALALARSLAAQGRFDPDDVAAGYVGWYRSGPFDVGGTTSRAFGGQVELGPGLASRLEARALMESEANGALMRVSPLGVFGWRFPGDTVAEMAAADARLSHPNPVCQAASAVFAAAIAHAVRTGEPPERVYAEARRVGTGSPVADVLVDAARDRPRNYVHLMGWVRIALQNAFYQLLHARTFEEGVRDTVMRGGDTDTNGAIAGALLGAVHGAGALPPQWRDAVLACNAPRPRAYRATDIPALADALLG